MENAAIVHTIAGDFLVDLTDAILFGRGSAHQSRQKTEPSHAGPGSITHAFVYCCVSEF